MDLDGFEYKYRVASGRIVFRQKCEYLTKKCICHEKGTYYNNVRLSCDSIVGYDYRSHNVDDEYETDDCQECIIIENSSNLITNFQEVSFSNNNINLFVSIYFNIIEFNAKKIYLSRSPPIS